MSPDLAWAVALAALAALFVWLVLLEERRKRSRPRPAPPIFIVQRPLTPREVAAYRRDWHGAHRTRAMPRRRNVPAYRVMRGHR